MTPTKKLSAAEACAPRAEPGGAASAERPADVAFRQIVRTLGLIDRAMQPYFSRFGISGSQWGLLRVLHRAELEGEPGLRLTDLSRRLVIRPPSVTGVVDRLLTMGLVTRTNDSDDLRVKQVALTPKARQLLAKILANHSQQIDLILGGLSSDDFADLQHLLGKLNAHLERLGSGDEPPAVDAASKSSDESELKSSDAPNPVAESQPSDENVV